MFPPVCLPNGLPQPPDLKKLGPALREKAVTGLLLSSPTPPALVVHSLVNLAFQVRADRRMAGQELIILAGNGLWRSSEKLASKSPFRGGAILSSGVSKAICHPPGGRSGPGIDSHSCHVGQASFPPVLVWDLTDQPSALTPGCGLRVLVGLLVAEDSVMGRDPADGNLIVSRQGSGAGHDGSNSKALARANAVRPDPVYGRSGVHKYGVAVATFLSLVDNAKSPEDGIHLCIKDLLVIA